jgi:hypothetical protein
MGRVGSLLNWIGGGVTRTAATGLVTGGFLVLFGMTPGEAIARLWTNPPTWLTNEWMRVIVLIVGIALIWVSSSFNRWSRRQLAIDALAEDIGWAIHHLLNRRPQPQSDEQIAEWDLGYRTWCDKINKQLENRAFFTRADQLHFDRLGFIDQTVLSGHPRYDWLLSQLRLKFERLREVINWSQERRR